MPISESEQYDLLDQLADEFAARFRRGERPTIKEYSDRYPDLADEIRELSRRLSRSSGPRGCGRTRRTPTISRPPVRL